MSWPTLDGYYWYSQRAQASYEPGVRTLMPGYDYPLYSQPKSQPVTGYTHLPGYGYGHSSWTNNYYQPTSAYPTSQHHQPPPYHPFPRAGTPQGCPNTPRATDLEVSVLPDFTPERWDGLSQLVPDTEDRVRTKSTRKAAPISTTRRSLFHNVDLDRLSTAHNLIDKLLGVTGLCAAEDSVLYPIAREGSSTPLHSTIPRDQSPWMPWMKVQTSACHRRDQPEQDRKRPASPAVQPPRKRARQNRASTCPLKASTPLKRALPGAAVLLPSPIPGKATRGSDKVYPCEQCEKVYRHRSSLASHRASHHTGKLHTCPQCNKSFSHLSTLLKHQRIHTNQRPYVCTTCGAGFTQAGNLHRHVRNVHSV